MANDPKDFPKDFSTAGRPASNENAPDAPHGENKDNGDTLPGAGRNKLSGDDSNTKKQQSKIGTGEGQVSPSASTSKLKETGDADTSVADSIASGDKVALYNVHAGLSPRVGGPYLDQVYLEQEEVRRAIVEKREPDFTNMAGSAGVPLVTGGQLVNAHAHTVSLNGPLTQMVDEHKGDNKLGPNPITEVDAVGESIGDDLNVEREVVRPDPLVAQEEVTSHDDPDVVFTQVANTGISGGGN